LIAAQPVIIVTVGFSLGSFEFNALLEEAAPSSEVYCLDVRQPEPSPPLTKLRPKFVRIEGKGGVGGSFDKLWQHISRSALPGLPLRSIGRHLLVTGLFTHRTGGASSPALDDEYFRDRALVEICLSFAKGKGLINLSELARDRVGTYFGKHAKHADASHNDAGSLTDLCKDLNLVCIGYGNETMTHNTNANSQSPQIMSRRAFKATRTFLLDKLRRALSAHAKPGFDANQALFMKTMDELYAAGEVEFRADTSVATRALFRKIAPLDNATAVSWRTGELLRGPWDTLLVVAETGEWLLKEKSLRGARRAGKRVCLIVADTSKEKSLKARFGDGLRLAKLDWWDHNRHMTIFVRDGKPEASIYFARRMRSASVAPVELGPDDSVTVLELFIAYWNRAKEPRPWISASLTRDQRAFFQELTDSPPKVKSGARRSAPRSRQRQSDSKKANKRSSGRNRRNGVSIG
jgi:hypothetical protein